MPTTAAPMRVDAVAISSQAAGLSWRQRMLGRAWSIEKVDNRQHYDARRHYLDETSKAIRPDRRAVLSV